MEANNEGWRQGTIPLCTKDGVLMDDSMTPVCVEEPETRQMTRQKYSVFKTQLEWGKKSAAVPVFPLTNSLMVLVLLLLILMGPFLIVKAGVMPPFSRFSSPVSSGMN